MVICKHGHAKVNKQGKLLPELKLLLPDHILHQEMQPASNVGYI